MTIDVAFTPAELGGNAGDRTIVVIDVLRATSTILEALVNGAQAVVPVESVEAAVAKAQEIGRDLALLCGERDTKPIPGFQLGNSPLEFTPDTVSGRTLVMTTTNGTRAVALGGTGERCLVASFLNAGAVAEALRDDEQDLLFLCAGREGRVAMEDAVCAGSIVRRLVGDRPRRGMSDAVITSILLSRRFERSLPSMLRKTVAGRRLIELGRAEDVAYCASADRHDKVPVVRERRVTL